MRAKGFDESSGRTLVVFEGDDARILGLALRAALEQVDDIDLPIRVGSGRVHVAALAKELDRVQALIDAGRGA